MMKFIQYGINTMKKKTTVALAGNPNSGKTTIFNAMTGARQHVGNYPGVTVEKKEGTVRHKDTEMLFVDLPGTYSLTAYSVEEVVARDFIINESPDVVIDIIDSSNLERNLYLATQLIELGVPLILAFNMSDVARSRGYKIDIEKLSDLLDVRIVPTVGNKGRGVGELLDAALEVAESHHAPRPSEVTYGKEMEEEIAKVENLLQTERAPGEKYSTRWLALKLLENDSQIREIVERSTSNYKEIIDQVEASTRHIEGICGDQPEIIVADRRYGFISGACQDALVSSVEARHTLSDRIDAVMTNRIVGLPIFAGLMFLVFHLVFSLGEPMMGWMEVSFEYTAAAFESMPEGILKSLIIDGIIGGVGGVMVFLPNILLLFLAIAVLEDSGYMARAAFIMDRLMHKIGLHGKSFIPMLIGFGCTVPAIMATRTLESRRDRLTTMLVAPLMSCGARLPIYILIIGAFFPAAWSGNILFLIYLIGIILAIISAKLLRSTIFKGASAPFVMELPPYRVPTLRGLFIHMWERSWLYLKKAGTIILVISILLWAATSFPRKTGFDKDYEALVKVCEAKRSADIAALESRTGMDNCGEVENLKSEIDARYDGAVEELHNEQNAEMLSYTVGGRIGHAIEPVIGLMGFDWRIGTALIGAFAAKEVFVAQMGIVFSLGEADEESDELRVQLRSIYSPLVGFCIMLFCLVSMPCVATFAVTKRESNSWRWALFQAGGLTVMAFVITVIAYQVGSLLKIGL